jgi:hypothetical protein
MFVSDGLAIKLVLQQIYRKIRFDDIIMLLLSETSFVIKIYV